MDRKNKEFIIKREGGLKRFITYYSVQMAIKQACIKVCSPNMVMCCNYHILSLNSHGVYLLVKVDCCLTVLCVVIINVNEQCLVNISLLLNCSMNY